MREGGQSIGHHLKGAAAASADGVSTTGITDDRLLWRGTGSKLTSSAARHVTDYMTRYLDSVREASAA